MIEWDEQRKTYYFHADITSVAAAQRAGFVFDKTLKLWGTPLWAIATKLCFREHDRTEIFKGMTYQQNKEIESFMLDSWFEPKCPEGKEFYPYQRAGIRYMMKYDNILLADPMGLGKTVQVIGLMNEMEITGRTLIICPARLRNVWRDHLIDWATFDLDYAVATSSLPEGFPTSKIVICDYGSLVKLSEHIKNIQWDLIVADESHFAKNPDAKRTQQIVGNYSSQIKPMRALRKKIAISGTPAISRPIEIHTVSQWLLPHGIPKREQYGKLYCGAFMEFGRWNLNGHSKLEELRRLLRSTIMIRRNKEEALPQLPPVRRQVICIEPDLRTRNILKRQGVELHRMGVKSGDMDSYDYEGIVKLIKTVKANFETFSADRKEAAVSKIPVVIEHLEDCLEYENKIVCFCHHKEVAEAIYDEFEEFSVMIHGGIPMERRDTLVKRFQTEERVRLFIGTIGTSGVGITLTAASLCVFAETPATPGEVSQAEDRLARIGQKNAVLAQHIVIDGTIDSYLIKLVVNKQNVLKQVMD